MPTLILRVLTLVALVLMPFGMGAAMAGPAVAGPGMAVNFIPDGLTALYGRQHPTGAMGFVRLKLD